MGIERWYSRYDLPFAKASEQRVVSLRLPSVPAAPGATSSHGDAPHEAAGPPPAATGIRAAAVTEADKGTPFKLCLAHYAGSCCLVFEVPRGASGLDGRTRQFVRDLARAIGADPASERISYLEWPLLEGARFRQSEDDAAAVVQSRVRDTVDPNRELLLVVGATIARLLPSAAGGRVETPALRDLMGSGAEKKKLWERLQAEQRSVAP